MKTLPLLLLGCFGLAACGEGDAPPANDGQATLLQALGLGDLPGAGDQLGTPPAAGDGLGLAPGGASNVSPPGSGDGLGRAPGAGSDSGEPTGDLCESLIDRIVECGFIDRDDRREAVKDCKDSIRRVPPATLAALRRCQPLSCAGLFECLSATQ